MKNTRWQSVAVALFSAFIASAGCWLAFGANRISRQEMTEYVRERVQQSRNNIAKIEGTLEKVLTAQQQLIIEQRVLMTKVDKLLEK